MSVVVGIKKDGVIYLGADSQTTRGGTRTSLSNPNNFKIWKVKGVEHCLIGHVGALRDACAVRIMDNLIREIDLIHDCIDFDYVVGRIMPMIIEQIKNFGYIDDHIFQCMASTYLFAYKDKLFVISGDGSVIEIDDCVAIGSGESEAIGSLVTTCDETNAQVRILKAIKASATHDLYVDYPIVLTDTASTGFTVISEKNILEMLK